MKYLSILTIFALSTGALSYTCDGQNFDNYCCVKGTFSGPVISSFDSSMSAITASISSQNSALSSSIASLTARAPMPTAAPQLLAKRVITTEVSAGLTCVGDSVTRLGNDGEPVSTSSAEAAKTGGAGAMVTQAPLLGGVAVAAGAWVYGAM